MRIYKEETKFKRVSSYKEFDNGHVLRSDWKEMSSKDAENIAKQKSIDDPDNIYYVAYDDVMDSSSNLRWINGKSYDYSQVQMRGNKPIIKNESVQASEDMDFSKCKKIISTVDYLDMTILDPDIDHLSDGELQVSRGKIEKNDYTEDDIRWQLQDVDDEEIDEILDDADMGDYWDLSEIFPDGLFFDEDEFTSPDGGITIYCE